MTGAEIRAIRERLDLTGPAFAALINERVPGAKITKQSVWRWESGLRHPSPAMAEAIRRIVSEAVRAASSEP
jgi:DNA-binding transcriptional regulator YiaG